MEDISKPKPRYFNKLGRNFLGGMKQSLTFDGMKQHVTSSVMEHLNLDHTDPCHLVMNSHDQLLNKL